VPAALELKHFTHVFNALGGTQWSGADVQNRRSMFTRQFQLAEADAALISSFADSFNQTIVPIDAARAAVLQNGTGSTPAGQQILATADQQQAQAVTALVAQLKAGLSAQAIQRIWAPLVDMVNRGH
jgi:hypothetical protein